MGYTVHNHWKSHLHKTVSRRVLFWPIAPCALRCPAVTPGPVESFSIFLLPPITNVLIPISFRHEALRQYALA